MGPFGIKTALVVVVVASALHFGYSMREFLGYDTTLTYNDAGCRLVAPSGLIGSEDFGKGKNGWVFISQGSLHDTFHHGAAAAAPGGLWVVNLASPRGTPHPHRLTLGGWPESRSFHPHGIYVSTTTDVLYAVVHSDDFSAVELFSITYHDHNKGPATAVPTLTHQGTVSSPLFPHYGINDVVEGSASGGELYVTQWLPYGYPKKGMKHPETLIERAVATLEIPRLLVGLRMTRFIRCTWDNGTAGLGGVSCEVADSKSFGGANGITISPDRAKVYVNDAPNKRITVYTRGPHGVSGGEAGGFDVPYAVDNIEWDNDEIVMGTIPKLHQAVANKDTPLTSDWSPVAGGMAVARQNDGDDWVTDGSVLMHDGTKLAQISAAARGGRWVLLGSPFSDGFLMCDTTGSA